MREAKAGAEQRGGAKAAQAAVASADARGEGKGAEQRGGKRGEASAAQHGGAKVAQAAVAAASARGEGEVMVPTAPSEAGRARRSAAARKPPKPP